MKSLQFFFIIIASVIFTSCEKYPQAFNNAPEVYVDDAENLLRTSAQLSGRLHMWKNSNIKECGFLIGLTSDLTGEDTQVYTADSVSMTFSQQILGLKSSTPYFYAAYLSNGIERIISTVKAFTTPLRSGAFINELELVDEKSATFSAKILDDGGGFINSIGFCWSTNENPTIFTGEYKLSELNVNNRFSASLLDLKEHTTYYVRAFVNADITGDGATTISYSESIEVYLDEAPCEIERPKLNEIWYTSNDGEIVNPTYESAFNANIISNIYDGEKGIITFDKNITMIGDKAFTLSRLKSIVLPECISTIGDSAFSGCSYLETVYIPESVISIGQGAFFLSSLKSINIPDSVTSIGALAFMGTQLESVIIPESVKKIDYNTFADCENLKSVTIQDTIEDVNDEAFSGCVNLAMFFGSASTIDHRCICIHGEIVAFARGELIEYKIPAAVTSIGKSVFMDCDNLLRVEIPIGIISIGGSAFKNCTNLKELSIGADVRSIDSWAFDGCENLENLYIDDLSAWCTIDFESGANPLCYVKNLYYQYKPIDSIEIPSDVVELSKYAFRGYAGLKSVTLHANLKKLGFRGFGDCVNLSKIVSLSETPPEGGNGCFDNIAPDAKIYVPANSVDAYKKSAYWRDLEDMIVPIE